MTMRPLWTGLAVCDTAGRVVVWRGSDTPKLYRSEEQSIHARTDGAELVPVTLVVGQILPATQADTAKAAALATAVLDAVRRYRSRECAHTGCGEVFTPTGARSLFCPRHTTARRA